MKRVEVAVGIVYDKQQRVLVGQRVVKDSYYKKWEFPGGKLESAETAEDALSREFSEELGIEVMSSEPFLVHEHDYPDRQVRLHIRIVTEYRGEVSGMEGQALKWVAIEEFDQLDFLQGNRAIIAALKARALNA